MESKELVARYYAKSAANVENAYGRPERQPDLGALREQVERLLRGHAVLELACGSGYWTRVIAAVADKVVATDIDAGMIGLACSRGEGAANVAYRVADAFALPEDIGQFTAVFVGAFWSHLERDGQEALLAHLRARLGKDVLLVLLDDAYVEGSSEVVARTDAQGTTWQIVTAPDGERFELPKTYPSDSALRKRLAAPAREIRITRLEHYWLLTCRLK